MKNPDHYLAKPAVVRAWKRRAHKAMRQETRRALLAVKRGEVEADRVLTPQTMTAVSNRWDVA